MQRFGMLYLELTISIRSTESAYKLLSPEAASVAVSCDEKNRECENFIGIKKYLSADN